MIGPLILAVVAVMGSTGVESASLGEPFRLPVSRSASVEETGMSLTFVSVERDSRCPKGVQCIRAGEAIVVFSITGDGETTEIRFEVPPGGGAEAELGEYIVSLELEPEARAGKRIERDAYVAIVTVTVAAGDER